MAWRMIFRRSPNRWMTVVGDPAQTGNPAGVESWAETLEPFVSDRWQIHQLTVNYRTPQDIADVAAQLLPEIAPEQSEPVALRTTGTGIRYGNMADVERLAGEALERAGDGLVGIISAHPESLPPSLRNPGSGDSGSMEAGSRNSGSGDSGSTEAGFGSMLDPEKTSQLVIADTARAKGLEFDEVIVVEPSSIVEASPQGLNDVYVAITRATQGLTVVHDQPLPWDPGFPEA